MRRTILLLSAVALVLSACGGGSESSGSKTPGASASVWTADRLAGTWTGVLVDPGLGGVSSIKVKFQPCAPGESCGQMDLKGADIACGGPLTYRGNEDGAFVFDEQMTRGAGACAPCEMHLKPMVSQVTLGVEELCDGTWLTYGALRYGEAS